ncbi:maleylpyruvate isomerase family mycothiol-dependent enzyme [Mycobacterium sp. URHD0025]|uniref:maleylpyruvate isomerase family mycothiol-dependent enzyme n=1 Tax=Mycobacterium sp. URHD0025 TaxID=1298864 RepID=UPI000418E055|nr:maleylpyruvate isomerase family mycothiol-dependent enzyme [Mycobacterium sp. URHD0025]
MSTRDMLRANDTRFAEVAATLGEDEWASPSLCTEWTNHEVLAHMVVGYSCGFGEFTAAIVRRRAFDPANTALAQSCAFRRSPGELLDDFRRLTDRPSGLGRYFPRRLLVGDHVTHELDILCALGREPRIPADTIIAVLNTQVALPNPFVPAYRNSRGLKLVATDVEWAHGEHGPLVEGRAAELVSVLGNRAEMLPRLHGEGVALLAARVLSRRTVG